MNRRSFLSFLSVAPVAVPMAAQAMLSHSQAAILEGEAGELITGSAFLDGRRKPVAYGVVRNWTPPFTDQVDAIAEANRRLALYHHKPLSVEAQMCADDLFDFEPQLRDTAEPTPNPQRRELVSSVNGEGINAL